MTEDEIINVDLANPAPQPSKVSILSFWSFPANAKLTEKSPEAKRIPNRTEVI